eukprot:scaffold165_cov265-Prasinococcus_capsulatus_cf.AAC.2
MLAPDHRHQQAWVASPPWQASCAARGRSAPLLLLRLLLLLRRCCCARGPPRGGVPGRGQHRSLARSLLLLRLGKGDDCRGCPPSLAPWPAREGGGGLWRGHPSSKPLAVPLSGRRQPASQLGVTGRRRGGMMRIVPGWQHKAGWPARGASGQGPRGSPRRRSGVVVEREGGGRPACE